MIIPLFMGLNGTNQGNLTIVALDDYTIASQEDNILQIGKTITISFGSSNGYRTIVMQSGTTGWVELVIPWVALYGGTSQTIIDAYNGEFVII